jgi:hypothetical protein
MKKRQQKPNKYFVKKDENIIISKMIEKTIDNLRRWVSKEMVSKKCIKSVK